MTKKFYLKPLKGCARVLYFSLLNHYKGTERCEVSERLTFDDYKTCLFDGETIYREQMLFENKKHEIYTVNKHKIALNRDDDKRLVQADGITTLARGYVAKGYEKSSVHFVQKP